MGRSAILELDIELILIEGDDGHSHMAQLIHEGDLAEPGDLGGLPDG